jgi:hypothetical protein
MINQYKRLDVFRCSQDAHRSFQGRVSVYHVLKEKACFPQGCLYFLWRCSRMEKGEVCVHKYKYIGKNCKGCTYYDEEKIHLQPEMILSPDEYARFLDDFEDFETWLESVRYRRHPLSGKINIIKPWFERFIGHQEKLRLLGYLLVFKRGFIGLNSFNDTFYVRVSEHLMKRYQFKPRMKIEMSGEIREDRGRIIVHRPAQIEIVSKGWGDVWSREKALVAVSTATLMKNQSESCLSCRWGALVDTINTKKNPPKRYRNLYCLKGIINPEGCYLRVNTPAGAQSALNIDSSSIRMTRSFTSR